MNITFLRHGRSRADDEGVHEGNYDSPLTGTGRAQAAALAAYWQAHPPGFERAFCSNLLRARETAEIVCNALEVPLTPTELLREWDNGPLAGMGREEALEKYPIPAFRHDFDPYTRDGGASQAAIRARALLALERLWQCGATNILVVTHGGFGNSMLRELLSCQRGWFAFEDTTYATVRLYRDSHTGVLTGVNLRPHLPAPS